MFSYVALFTQLTDDPGVSALVDERVFPEFAPMTNQTYPQIVIATPDAANEPTFDGPINLMDEKIDVVAIAKTITDVVAVAKAILAAIDGQTGTWGGTVIKGCFLKGTSNTLATIPDLGPDYKLEMTTLTFRLRYDLPA